MSNATLAAARPNLTVPLNLPLLGKLGIWLLLVLPHMF